MGEKEGTAWPQGQMGHREQGGFGPLFKLEESSQETQGVEKAE